VTRSAALVVINGDDVYEDLFTAGLKLQDLLVQEGFAARVVLGTARLTDCATADLIVLYTALGQFPPSTQSALADAVAAGAGLIAVHASNVFPSSEDQLDEDYRRAFELVGSRYASHGPPPHESRFRVETDQRHPVTRGLAPFDITHEHYQLELAAGAHTGAGLGTGPNVLAWRGTAAGREPIVHVRPSGRGRVCYLQLGHDMRAWDDPPVRELFARSARWAARTHEPVESR
jgi:type 1 glutamine amidotransferase